MKRYDPALVVLPVLPPVLGEHALDPGVDPLPVPPELPPFWPGTASEQPEGPLHATVPSIRATINIRPLAAQILVLSIPTSSLGSRTFSQLQLRGKEMYIPSAILSAR